MFLSRSDKRGALEACKLPGNEEEEAMVIIGAIAFSGNLCLAFVGILISTCSVFHAAE